MLENPKAQEGRISFLELGPGAFAKLSPPLLTAWSHWAWEMARKRKAIKDDMRQAVLNHDMEKVFYLAECLTGNNVYRRDPELEQRDLDALLKSIKSAVSQGEDHVSRGSQDSPRTLESCKTEAEKAAFFEEALKIAQECGAILDEMNEAVLAHDVERVFHVAERLTGVKPNHPPALRDPEVVP